jgi:hypothetical protein
MVDCIPELQSPIGIFTAKIEDCLFAWKLPAKVREFSTFPLSGNLSLGQGSPFADLPRRKRLSVISRNHRSTIMSQELVAGADSEVAAAGMDGIAEQRAIGD